MTACCVCFCGRPIVRVQVGEAHTRCVRVRLPLCRPTGNALCVAGLHFLRTCPHAVSCTPALSMAAPPLPARAHMPSPSTSSCDLVCFALVAARWTSLTSAGYSAPHPGAWALFAAGLHCLRTWLHLLVLHVPARRLLHRTPTLSGSMAAPPPWLHLLFLHVPARCVLHRTPALCMAAPPLPARGRT
jgi:hypothetical protein